MGRWSARYLETGKGLASTSLYEASAFYSASNWIWHQWPGFSFFQMNQGEFWFLYLVGGDWNMAGFWLSRNSWEWKLIPTDSYFSEGYGSTTNQWWFSWLISLDFFSAKFVFSWWLIWLVHTYEIIWTCMNMQFVCVMYTFWSSNMAMGNSPFIDDFPNFNGHLRGCPSQPYFITGDYIPILIPVIVNINHR